MEDEQQLADAELAIRRARPPLLGVFGTAAVVAVAAYFSTGTLPQAVRIVFAVSAALLAGGGVFSSVKNRARRSETDRFLTAFALERGWVYSRAGPLLFGSPLLAHGTRQQTGRGFTLTLDARRARLYEHIRIDGSGRSQTQTSYVVLHVEAALTRAVGLRIRANEGFPVDGPPVREFELESTELSQGFLVEAPPYLDELELRDVLTPSVITAFLDLAHAECYLGDYLEIGVGSVLLASLGTITLEDGEYLDATIPAAQPLLDKLLSAGAGAAA